MRKSRGLRLLRGCLVRCLEGRWGVRLLRFRCVQCSFVFFLWRSQWCPSQRKLVMG